MGCALCTKPVKQEAAEEEQLPKQQEEVKTQRQPFQRKSAPRRLESARTVAVSASQFVFIKKENYHNHYHVGQLIGQGSFGKVMLAFNKRNNEPRAIKSINKSTITPDEKAQFRYFAEMDILRSLQHPNIIRVFEVFEDNRCYHMVTEFCAGGELFSYIVKRQPHSESFSAHVMHQLLSAVKFFHSKGIVHCDLKPENLLLEAKPCSMNIQNVQIKVIDFGTAMLAKPNQKLERRSGTAYYIAPEVLKRCYDHKADIWSCGVIMYVLLSGRPPFKGKNDQEIFRSVLSGQLQFPRQDWANVSEEAQKLIVRMLVHDPDERPSAEEILDDPWFNQLQSGNQAAPRNLGSTMKNLRNFNSEAKLQQAASSFIASQLLTSNETTDMHKAFNQLDVNNDGRLSREEIKTGYKKIMGIEISDQEVNEIMARVDTDNSGYIDYNEYIAATTNKQKMFSRRNLEQAFKLFDQDGNGKISSKEVMQILGDDHVTLNICKDIIREVDSDGNGIIDLAEFKEMLAQV